MEKEKSWQDVLYERTLSDELLALERRFHSANCSVSDLERTLKHLYISEGADWGGRGEVQDIIMSATIAAHEAFMARIAAAR